MGRRNILGRRDGEPQCSGVTHYAPRISKRLIKPFSDSKHVIDHLIREKIPVESRTT